MRINPVLTEGVEIYLVEGRGFMAYFYSLVTLAGVEFLILFLPSLDAPAWRGSANLLKICSVAALVLAVYWLLRLANQEFVPWRFAPLKRWLHQEGMSPSQLALGHIALLSLHLFLMVLLASPLLVWAGAIARAAPFSILSVLSLILFYGLTYGVWGMAALALWERQFEKRQVFVRCLFIALVFLSAIVYFPLSPIAFVLAHLDGRDLPPLLLWGWEGPAWAVHFLFHFFILGSGLLVHRWALEKGALH